MATAKVLVQPTMVRPSFKPIIDYPSTERKLADVKFDPDQHLAFEEPKRTIMMTDIGFSKDTGISNVAVTEPFRLFSKEAVQKFRDEALSDEAIANCAVKSNIAAYHVRGFVPKYGPFTHDAFHNPKTLEVISKVAGVELIPSMDYEIAHINISVKSEQEANEDLAKVKREGAQLTEGEGSKPIVGWHNDSYPFVCVVMLSDCTNMVGGETALRTGSGRIMKVRGPEMGCAVVMQGRYITHQALRALGAQERITSVTSFRAKSPSLADDADLHTCRGISDVPELYYQYGKYRLEILEARIRDQIKRLGDDHAAGKKTNIEGLKRFLDGQERFLRHTNVEMVPENEVVAGHQPEMDLPNVDDRQPHAKGASMV